MAIKIGKKSEENGFKMYQGVAAFNVAAVNPNKKVLGDLTGRDIEEEPEYIGTDENGNQFVRVTFWLKTDPMAKVNNGIELLTSTSFTLVKAQRVGQSSGKIQVIDKYGRTAWATPEEVKNKEVPQYKNGPANIDHAYRAAFQGEESLVNFLISWLNIPNPAKYKDGKWVMNQNAGDSEIILNYAELFKGNVKELNELVSLASTYLVKAAVGIRTTDDNKQYHQVFNRMFLKNAATDYSRLDAEITNFKSNGGAPNTEYSVEPLHEYVVEATDFSADTNNEDPFSSDLPWS